MKQPVADPWFHLPRSGSLAVEAAPTMLASSIGFFFTFRLFFVLLAVRIFGFDAQVGVGASLALNFALLALVAFQSVGPAALPFKVMRGLPCMRWVMAFLAMTGASLLWTQAVSLPAATAFWAAMVADTAMVILLLRTGSINAVTNAIMKGNIWAASIMAVIAWALPSQSDLRLGDEQLLGPNQIGYACAFALFFVQYLVRIGEGRWTLHAVVLALTMLRSLSKTTIIAFLVAQAYVLLRDRAISRKTKQVVVLSAFMVLALFSGLLAKYYDVYMNAGNQSETLTGRLGIWAYFLSEALQLPWTGHGFHSVWKVIPPFGIDQFEARHAHNELLQQFYVYGLMGIVMWLAVYGSVFKNLRRLDDPVVKISFLSMLIFVVIRGLADTEPFDLSLPMWTIAMVACLIYQSRLRSEAFA